jgi:hypothetical protein
MTADTRNKDFMTPHSTNKGYPFTAPASQDLYPLSDRAGTFTNEQGMSFVNVVKTSDEKFNTELTECLIKSEGVRTPFEDYLIHRINDFDKALSLAEGQITDLLTDSPFLPEDFGFILVHKNSVSEPPARIYASKYYATDEKRFFLFREPAPDNINEWNPEVWVLQTHENGKVHDEKVRLNCHRIAYAFFLAKMIKVED